MSIDDIKKLLNNGASAKEDLDKFVRSSLLHVIAEKLQEHIMGAAEAAHNVCTEDPEHTKDLEEIDRERHFPEHLLPYKAFTATQETVIVMLLADMMQAMLDTIGEIAADAEQVTKIPVSTQN